MLKIKTMVFLRVILNILLALSIMFLPWWISVVLAFALLFLYAAYEVLFWGLVMDMLYSAPIGAFFGIELIFTILFVLLFIFAGYCKQWFMLYNGD